MRTGPNGIPGLLMLGLVTVRLVTVRLAVLGFGFGALVSAPALAVEKDLTQKGEVIVREHDILDGLIAAVEAGESADGSTHGR